MVFTFKKTACWSLGYLSLSLQNGVLRNQGDTGVGHGPLSSLSQSQRVRCTKCPRPRPALRPISRKIVCASTMHKMSRKLTQVLQVPPRLPSTWQEDGSAADSWGRDRTCGTLQQSARERRTMIMTNKGYCPLFLVVRLNNRRVFIVFSVFLGLNFLWCLFYLDPLFFVWLFLSFLYMSVLVCFYLLTFFFVFFLHSQVHIRFQRHQKPKPSFIWAHLCGNVQTLKKIHGKVFSFFYNSILQLSFHRI